MCGVIYFHVNFPLSHNDQYTAQFYAAIASSVISYILGVLVFIDYELYKRATNYTFNLSINQRVMIFSSFLGTFWCILGSIIYGYTEGWTFTQGIFFSLVTITTIGFGDYVPTKTISKIILLFYATIGIVIMGVFLNSITKAIDDYLHSKVVSSLVKFKLKLAQSNNNSKQKRNHNPSGSINDDIFIKKDSLSVTSRSISGIPISDKNSMEESTYDYECKLLVHQLFFAIIIFSIFWTFTAGIFSVLQGWSYSESLYFCYIAFSTIGYGDHIPDKMYAGTVFIVFILIGLVAVSYLISVVTNFMQLTMETHSTKAELKRKYKNSLKRLSRASTNELLEQSIDAKEIDIVRDLMSVAKCHQKNMTSLLKDLNDIEQLNDNPVKDKIYKYQKLYDNLCVLFEKKLNE